MVRALRDAELLAVTAAGGGAAVPAAWIIARHPVW
jgi:hypothetical protein